MLLNNRNVVLESMFSFVVFCIVSSSQQQQQRDFNNNNRYYVVDEGQNLTLPCTSENGPVMWVREGKKEEGIQEVLPNGSLQLINLSVNDAGTYTCSAVVSGLYETVNVGVEDNSVHNENFTQETVIELARIDVNVRTVPGLVATFKCRATTIIAVIIWEVWPNRTGGYPILDFTAEMRRMPDYGENETEWTLLDPHHISPNARQLEIFHLSPNTTYEFRIWGNNKLGAGEKALITATTVPKTEEKGFCDSDDQQQQVKTVAPTVIRSPSPITTQTYYAPQSNGAIGGGLTVRNHHHHHHHHHHDETDDIFNDNDEEPMTFSRKMSIFFTGNTIKRI
uniref:CSON003813 protein n=1 Tax=Culicoides sonorensis TaxID=179676 RepID=A0A336L3L2_CULSO